MKFKIINILICVFFSYELNAQTITGSFTQLAMQEIKLEGFNGLNSYPISAASIDERGNFKL